MSHAYATGTSTALSVLGLRKVAVDIGALLRDAAPHLKDVALHTLGGTALGGLSGLASSDEDRMGGLARGALAGGITGLGVGAGSKGLQYLTGRMPHQISALETEGGAKLDAYQRARDDADTIFDAFNEAHREREALEAANASRALRRPEMQRLEQLREQVDRQMPEMQDLAKDYDAAQREYEQYNKDLTKDVAARKADAALVSPISRGATMVVAPTAGILAANSRRDDDR